MPWYVPVRGSVFWEELRRRLRNGRGQLVLLCYGLTLIVLLAIMATVSGNAGNPREWPAFGASLVEVDVLAGHGRQLPWPTVGAPEQESTTCQSALALKSPPKGWQETVAWKTHSSPPGVTIWHCRTLSCPVSNMTASKAA